MLMRLRAAARLCAIFMTLAASAFPAATLAIAKTASTPPPAAPLVFVENVGQLDARARFVLQGSGGTLFVAEGAIWLAQSGTGSARPGVNLRLSFPGAAAHPQIEPFGRLSSRVSVFRGAPTSWRADVPAWAGVRYRDLYPGIDLELAGANGQLMPQLIVRAGADLGAVRLQIDGADSIALDAHSIRLNTAAGPVSLPLFQAATPAGQPIVPGQNLRPTLRANEVAMPIAAGAPAGAEAAAQNETSLVYSTYLGGSDSDAATTIAVDASGFVYAGGITQSLDFPTTPGAFVINACGCQDVFVVKFRPGDNQFVYATYLGGNSDDDLYGLAIDDSGSAYVTGFTYADNFPTTTGAYDTECGTDGICNLSGEYAQGDTFVSKLNADGSALAYSTYLGGSGHDRGLAIALDASGAAYITGHTESHDFPHSDGTQYSGNLDAFAAKLSPAGSQLVYATYIGGSGDEDAFDQYDNSFGGIAVEAGGAAYVVGSTSSANFPVSSGSGAAKSIDTFVVKLAPNGAQREFSRLFGGTGKDVGKGIALSAAGVYVLGNADSASQFPIAGAPYDSIFGGGTEMFLLRLTTAGEPTYGSWLGGDGQECVIACAIALGANGDIYLTGETTSSNFPTTPDAYSTTAFDSNDIFVARLSADATQLRYGSYLGKPKLGAPNAKQDYAYAIAADADGNAYVAGETDTSDFPTTADALYRESSGGIEAVVAKLATETTYSVGGVVLGLNGQPLAGATVADDAGHAALTDADGAYTLRGLAGRSYTLRARRLGYSFEPAAQTITLPTNSKINFIAKPAAIHIPIAQVGPASQPQVCDPYETNNDRTQPLFELTLGQAIQAKICASEQRTGIKQNLIEDNYALRLPSAGTLAITLDLPDKLRGDAVTALAVYSERDYNKNLQGCYVASVTVKNFVMSCPVAAAGKYVVRIYTRGQFDDANAYTLTARLQ